MPGDLPPDDTSVTLDDVLRILRADTVAAVLRTTVEAACRLSSSSRGRAGLFDGEAATSDGRYDRETGWHHERARWERGSGAPGRACASRAPLLVDQADVPAGAPGTAADGLGLGSLVCVPLLDGEGALLGFVEVGDPGRSYTAHDAGRLAALARVAAHRLIAIAGDDGRLAAEQAALADVADRLQRRLLPAEPPSLPGLDIALTYRSASAGVLSGGDFVDYYSRPPSANLAFAIGDVCGKGVEAMATTFVTKYMLRAAVLGSQISWPTRPGEALQELRNGLLEQPDFGPASERFVTVLFGLLDPRLGLLQMASAGHPTPLLVREGTVERPLLLTEPAIGVELGAALEPYPTESLQLEQGDLVVMFTDGLAELRDAGGRFFEDRMAAELAGCHGLGAAAVVERLLGAAERFAARPPADDLAVLCIRLTARPDGD